MNQELPIQFINIDELSVQLVNNSWSGQEWHIKLMNEIRAYNRLIIGELNKCAPVDGKSILDVGASVHGFALEAAFELGVKFYLGVTLGLQQTLCVLDNGRVGMVINRDITHSELPASSFDLVVSMSTFEHILDVPVALTEMWQVLKPGGKALITFDTIWTCSYGHHLHVFTEQCGIIQPWSHLIYDAEEFRKQYQSKWKKGYFTYEQAESYVYHGSEINRLKISDYRRMFNESPFKIEWLVELPDENGEPTKVQDVASLTGIPVNDLLVKGISTLLSKPA